MGKPIISSDDVLAYYRRQSRFTDPGEYASLYDGLPEGISDLCTVLQGAILHMFWIGEKTYGVTTEELKAAGREICVEFAYETAEERLRNIVSLDERPLAEPRPADVRSVGCCRDLAMMLVSILRHRGIPARVRTGVARYFFTDGKLEDHYLCESWNAEERRWQLTDPQIDAVQRAAIGLTMHTIEIGEVVLGGPTGVAGGTLTVDADEVRALVLEDSRIADVALEVAAPGDSARIVHCLDAVEPRAKVGDGTVFPGIL
ncbi:MAG: hypothetical protein JSW65_04450, partial [Candidatus Bipolaricaulota bacterium]